MKDKKHAQPTKEQVHTFRLNSLECLIINRDT